MYQLTWARGTLKFSVIGDLVSLLEVYTPIKGEKWDVMELWQLGSSTVKIVADGKTVPWWGPHS